MNELVEKVADFLKVSPAQLAGDIWDVAMLIEQNRNRGYQRYELEPAVPVYMLVEEANILLDGIMFEMFDGPRSRRFSVGWMVRKNPNWRGAWKLRFGEYAPDRLPLIDAWRTEQEAEAARAAEVAKLKRKTEHFSEGRFEDFTSLQIAYRAAVAVVLMRRYRELRWIGALDNTLWRWQVNIWREQYELMIAELYYRTKAVPEPRKSKKKTDAAIEDFARARELLAAGAAYFFSKAYQEQILAAADEPDLTVDFEHLPRQPLAKTPVRWLSEGDVIKSFMGFLSGAEAGSFEWDDAQLILTTLRKLLARAKGQKIEDGPEARISVGTAE